MPQITIINSSGQDLFLTVPNGQQEVFKNGQTKIASATGTYLIKNGNTTITSIDFESGTMTSTINSLARVSILYFQLGCQPIKLSMSILIDIFHRNKKCPELNIE
jgi:hypothetical protein